MLLYSNSGGDILTNPTDGNTKQIWIRAFFSYALLTFGVLCVKCILLNVGYRQTSNYPKEHPAIREGRNI